MAAFVHIFAPRGAAMRTELNAVAPRNTVTLTCRWRRAPDGQLVSVWSRADSGVGDEPAPTAFAAAA